MTKPPKVTAVWTDPHAEPVVTDAPPEDGRMTPMEAQMHAAKWAARYIAFAFALGVMLGVAFAKPAAAQGAACLPRGPLVTLWQERGAVRVGDGTSGPWVVETWVAPTGLWIIWQANAEGFACIIGAGRDWHPAPPKGDDA